MILQRKLNIYNKITNETMVYDAYSHHVLEV